MEDSGAAQRGCCAILAYLAKSPENRLLLVQVPGLMDASFQSEARLDCSSSS
jgi:hypothetical protein